MKYIYGPVNSRRLGKSLGISLTSYKICSFDCIYCQLGVTTEITLERKEYVSIEEPLAELRSWLDNNAAQAKELDYISLSGSGEPTLNIKIGEVISEIHKLTGVPVAVITNASLLHEPQVRSSLMESDLIVPSLDAVTSRIFAKIDRPKPDIKIEDIIAGLIELRREFKGKLWLEIMLVSGINDDLRHIKKIKEVVDRINPDKVQLNSPVRTASGLNIFAVDRKKLEKIQEILGDKAQII